MPFDASDARSLTHLTRARSCRPVPTKGVDHNSMLVSAPMNMPGSTGSPANAVVIK